MSHDRRGLTVLSLLLILIVLGLITALVIRSMRADDPALPIETPGFALQLVRAPDGALPPGASDTVTVRAVDGTGAPLAGFPVNFTIAGGNGSVEPASASTDAAGAATAVWTVGTDPITNQLSVTLDGSDTQPVVISVEVPGATP